MQWRRHIYQPPSGAGCSFFARFLRCLIGILKHFVHRHQWSLGHDSGVHVQFLDRPLTVVTFHNTITCESDRRLQWKSTQVHKSTFTLLCYLRKQKQFNLERQSIAILIRLWVGLPINHGSITGSSSKRQTGSGAHTASVLVSILTLL